DVVRRSTARWPASDPVTTRQEVPSLWISAESPVTYSTTITLPRWSLTDTRAVLTPIFCTQYIMFGTLAALGVVTTASLVLLHSSTASPAPSVTLVLLVTRVGQWLGGAMDVSMALLAHPVQLFLDPDQAVVDTLELPACLDLAPLEHADACGMAHQFQDCPRADAQHNGHD